MHLNIFTIEYYKHVTDNDDIFIKKFIDNRHNFPNLKVFDVCIYGTNSYYNDLAKYEQLFFLFDDELIENIRITNGYDVIYKKNGKICARVPYSKTINLHPRINNIYFTLHGLYSESVNFITIFDNFPTSLKKIIFVVTLSVIPVVTITILDKSQKLPFGVELFLELNGRGLVENIDFQLCNYVLNVKSTVNITFGDEIRKNKNFVFM